MPFDQNPTDPFYVIGFTSQQIAEGSIRRIMQLRSHINQRMFALQNEFGPLGAAETNGKVVSQRIEVYFLDPLIAPYVMAEYGNYQIVQLLNIVAFRLCRQYGVHLPPVIDKTVRASIPAERGVTLQGLTYSSREEANILPEQVPAFSKGDYVRLKISPEVQTGTIEGSRFEEGGFRYRFQPDDRLKNSVPQGVGVYSEDEIEICPRPNDDPN